VRRPRSRSVCRGRRHRGCMRRRRAGEQHQHSHDLSQPTNHRPETTAPTLNAVTRGDTMCPWTR
jgi:hypothetical protein